MPAPTWLSMTREERGAAISAAIATGADATRLARVHRTSPEAVAAHAARAGIVFPATVVKPADVGATPPATKGGRHEVAKGARAARSEPEASTPATPRRFSGTGWTDERLAALPELLGQGFSASTVAEVLGGGLTRNAVIGKAHRVGAPMRARKSLREARSRKPAAPKSPTIFFKKSSTPKATPTAPLPPEPVIELPPLMLGLEQLEPGQCRFPIGDPQVEGFGFCGHPQTLGRPYCEAHCRIAYVPVEKRVRRDRSIAYVARAA